MRVKVSCHLTVPPAEAVIDSVIAPSRRVTDGAPRRRNVAAPGNGVVSPSEERTSPDGPPPAGGTSPSGVPPADGAAATV